MAATGDEIPSGIYWSREAGNFYDQLTNRGMGVAFYKQWQARKDEFPEKSTTSAGLDLSMDRAVLTNGQGKTGMKKYLCRECSWHGTEDKVLRAPNPFADDVDTMLGCPQCREANRLRVACDEAECWHEVSCGTPTPQGYRQTCHEHWPNRPSKSVTDA